MMHTVFSFSFGVRVQDLLRKAARGKKEIYLLCKSSLLYTMPDQYQPQLKEEHTFCFHFWKNEIGVLKPAAVFEYTKTLWNYQTLITFTCSKTTIETLQKCAKMCEICLKLTIKLPERH